MSERYGDSPGAKARSILQARGRTMEDDVETNIARIQGEIAAEKDRREQELAQGATPQDLITCVLLAIVLGLGALWCLLGWPTARAVLGWACVVGGTLAFFGAVGYGRALWAAARQRVPEQALSIDEANREDDR